MRYLYGDSSSFPLNQNFIVTLSAATDCAVELLMVDEAVRRARKTADKANSAAAREVADIEQLMQKLERAMADRDHLSNATAKVVEQVAASAKAQFERARSGIKSWRNATISKASAGTGPAEIMAPLHRFLIRHELPYTSWGLRWKAGQGEEPVQAQVYALMQRGLTATLGVNIPEKHFWSAPVRVAALERKLVIPLLGKNWLGKEKVLEEQLEKYFITRITRTNDRHAFILSRKPKEQTEGIRISLREGDKRRVMVTRIDENEAALGEPAALDGNDAQAVRKLWRMIEESICDLVHHRRQLLAATLQDKRITELDTPQPVAEAIIQSVAPLVRDMAAHSRTPGELQLKRDLGDGRREELFISNEEVVRKYVQLTPRGQSFFDAYGLTKADVSAELGMVPEPRPSESDAAIMESGPRIQHHALPAYEPPPLMTTPSTHPGAVAPNPPNYNAPPSAAPPAAEAQPAAHSAPPQHHSAPPQHHSAPPQHHSAPPQHHSAQPPASRSAAPPAPPPSHSAPPPRSAAALPAPSKPPPRRRSSRGGASAPPGDGYALPKPSAPPPKRSSKHSSSAPPSLKAVGE